MNFFRCGTIFNHIPPQRYPKVCYSKVTIKFPTRLNAMAVDPSKILLKEEMIYSPGEVVFSTDLFIEVSIELIEDEKIVIAENSYNKDAIINHICLIMKKLLNFNGGFRIKIKKYHKYRHCGLGSSGCLQSAIGVGINYIFGNPYDDHALLKLLARNYGEEIDNEKDLLNPVQCIGGSAASGLFDGGIIIILGNNTVVVNQRLPKDSKIYIGMPKDIALLDSKLQFHLEKENLHKFKRTGDNFKLQNAYNVLHFMLPAIIESDLKMIGDVIFDYRYNMGSIDNCSFVYPNLKNLFEQIKPLKENNIVEILSISSIGPSIFIITNRDCEKQIKRIYEENDLECIEARIYNGKYEIIECERKNNYHIY